MKKNLRHFTTAALMLAVGFLLPFVTGHVPSIARLLSPMHIPVMLCGFLCGGGWGVMVGFSLPLLRSVLLGMPALVPNAVVMAFELGAYGFFTGFLLRRCAGRSTWKIMGVLFLSMILGRVVWGGASFWVYRAMGSAFTWHLFFVRGFVSTALASLFQLSVLPVVVKKLLPDD